MNYRGKRLFAGRLFAGRLWGPPLDTDLPTVWPGSGGHVSGRSKRRLPTKRRRDTDDDVLMFLLR